ncbi:MAG: hypothetical protein EOP40_00555 [Rubrivivax sp.]|nr:MAG: hypothetical protein EOP40_00555 [Rubrivivax sp.]
MFRTLSIDVGDTTQIATARRAAIEMAVELGFNEADAGRAALLATEASTNLLKHAGHGELLLSAHFTNPHELVMTALDQGPGFHPEQALQDGYSTTGTLGGGLGAMQRGSCLFQLYTRHGRGSVVRMVLRRTGEPASAPSAVSQGLDVAGLGLPYPGESVCGDAWMCHDDGHSLVVTVADGLGHGLEARRASALAIDASLALDPSAAPGEPAHRRPHEMVMHMHAALRGTRGAALATALIDASRGTLSYAGIGNIAGLVASGQGQKHLLSLPGIVGHNVRKVQGQEQPWPRDAVLIMHSDGLATHWSLRDDPELIAQPAGIIASVLYRDHRRGRDDVTVVVVKARAPS